MDNKEERTPFLSKQKSVSMNSVDYKNFYRISDFEKTFRDSMGQLENIFITPNLKGAYVIPKIHHVLYNKEKLTTTVIWNDDTVTVVKTNNSCEYDERRGLAFAIMKKYFGNQSKINKFFSEETKIKRVKPKYEEGEVISEYLYHENILVSEKQKYTKDELKRIKQCPIDTDNTEK